MKIHENQIDDINPLLHDHPHYITYNFSLLKLVTFLP